MRASVILCTYNRCELLGKALEDLVLQRISASLWWELIVVDNNSTDQTTRVVERAAVLFQGKLKYVRECKQGKSYALNRGVFESAGDILVFVDDDVTISKGWLQSICAPFENPNVAGVGGRILPEWQTPPPPWIPFEDHYGLAPLVSFDFGQSSARLDEAPFGANMAFRREMFDKYGLFRNDLGPCPGSEIRGEDSEWASRLLKAGERLNYEPSALIYHPVPEQRSTKEYFLRWWFDKGRSEARVHTRTVAWRIGNVPLLLIRRLVANFVRWSLTRGASRRFRHKLAVWANAGSIVEHFRRRSG